jgi:hypothetical protein
MNNELDIMWKESVITQSNVLSLNFLYWTGGKTGRTSVRTVSQPKFEPDTSVIEEGVQARLRPNACANDWRECGA